MYRSLLAFILLFSVCPVNADDEDYYVVRYLPGDNWDESLSYDEQPGLAKHREYLNDLHINDQLVMGGVLHDEAVSMVVLRTRSLQDAQGLVEQDPGVKAAVVRAVVSRWQVSMSSLRFVRRKALPVENSGQTIRLKRQDPDSRLQMD